MSKFFLLFFVSFISLIVINILTVISFEYIYSYRNVLYFYFSIVFILIIVFASKKFKFFWLSLIVAIIISLLNRFLFKFQPPELSIFISIAAVISGRMLFDAVEFLRDLKGNYINIASIFLVVSNPFFISFLITILVLSSTYIYKDFIISGNSLESNTISLNIDENYKKAVISKQGNYLVLLYEDSLEVLSIPNGNKIFGVNTLEHGIYDFAIRYDEEYFFGLSSDSTVKVWGIPSGKKYANFEKTDFLPTSIIPKNDNTGLIVYNKSELAELNMPSRKLIFYKAFPGNDLLLVFGNKEKRLGLFENGNLYQIENESNLLELETGIFPKNAKISNDNKYILIHSYMNKLSLFNLENNLLEYEKFLFIKDEYEFSNNSPTFAEAGKDIFIVNPDTIGLTYLSETERGTAISFYEDNLLVLDRNKLIINKLKSD